MSDIIKALSIFFLNLLSCVLASKIGLYPLASIFWIAALAWFFTLRHLLPDENTPRLYRLRSTFHDGKEFVGRWWKHKRWALRTKDAFTHDFNFIFLLHMNRAPAILIEEKEVSFQEWLEVK